jgi:hypothetical protein
MRSSASSPALMYRLMSLRKSCQLARLDPIGPNMLRDCAMHWPSFRHGRAWPGHPRLYSMRAGKTLTAGQKRLMVRIEDLAAQAE